MEVLIKRYIQNYYEVHGNFDKIELSPLSEQIRLAASEEGLSIRLFCIRALGYPENTTGLDLEIFAHWQLQDFAWFLDNKLAPDEKSVASFVKDHKYDWPLVYRERNKKEVKVNAAVELLTTYYNENSELKAVIDDVEYGVKDFILLLKIGSGRLPTQTVISALKKSKLLVTFKETAGEQLIYNGVFYHNGLTEAQINKVQKEAVSNLINGMNMRTSVIKNIDSLPFLSVNSPKIYLSLLDMCRGLGITYAQYMKTFGLNIKDQTPLLERYKMLIMVLGDMAYVTTEDSTVKAPIQQIPLEQLKTMLSL